MPKAPPRTELVAKAFDGRLRLERINGSPYISARTFVQGKAVRKSTREKTEAAALAVAQQWYETLIAKKVLGIRIHSKSFADVVASFLKRQDEIKEVGEGHRRNYKQKWNVLKPYFKDVSVTDIDATFLTTLRTTRSAIVTNRGTKIRPSTLKQDQVFISQVLKHAVRHEKCLDVLPVFPSFRGEMRIHPNARPFLTFPEYKHLVAVAQQRWKEPGLNPRVADQRRETYWFALISVGAALRPGEAHSIRWWSCEIVTLKDGTLALQMVVRGKHGRGGPEDAFGLFHAVPAFKQMRKARPDAKPDDPLFLENHRDGLNELLEAAGLKVVADGRTRDAKSFRPTAISMKLETGDNPDFYDIAKWARTSPQQIKDFYDQNHPRQSVERISGYRKPKKSSASTA